MKGEPRRPTSMEARNCATALLCIAQFLRVSQSRWRAVLAVPAVLRRSRRLPRVIVSFVHCAGFIAPSTDGSRSPIGA